MPTKIGDDERAQIMWMKAMGKSNEEIADGLQVDVSPNTVSRHFNELKQEIDQQENDEQEYLKWLIAGAIAAGAVGAAAASSSGIINGAALHEALDEQDIDIGEILQEEILGRVL